MRNRNRHFPWSNTQFQPQHINKALAPNGHSFKFNNLAANMFTRDQKTGTSPACLQSSLADMLHLNGKLLNQSIA
ncbi:hypothetical protein SAMN06295888_1606 [Desulfonatronum zhilinae]|nr:hypothetical protein SAMN06295888_1606 [Desulfonatronum zhilinae]